MKLFISLMKIIFTFFLIIVLISLVFIKKDDIIAIMNLYIINRDLNTSINEYNEYYRDYNFSFVKNTNNFTPHNYQDILNIYYTMINSGKTNFTFYCHKEYKNCTKDIQSLANNQALLSDINNFVHPFNSFSHIETEYDSLGRITISTIKSYSTEDISMIEEEVDRLFEELVSSNLSLEQNIKIIHDYIINNSKYDSNRSDYNDTTYHSDTAYGPLFEGYAICGGYTDLMQLFLEKLNVKNYRISSNRHIWNALEINGRWLHLDLTWDDPVSTDGRNYLDYKYFMIDTNTLLNQEKTQHEFNLDIYKELKGV